MADKSNLEIDVQDLNSEDPAIRRVAAEKYLSEDAPDEIVKVLSEKLADSDFGVRDAAAQVLMLNDNSTIPEYVVKYISSDEISVRNLAGEILLKRGVSSLDAMISYLPEGDDDDDKFLIDVMGLIGDPRPADEIIAILKKTTNENVILACIEALGNIKYDKATKEIISNYDKNENFTPTIIEALGKIGSEEALNFMLEKYHEVDELTKFSMIESMGLIGTPQAFFLLLSEIRNLKDAMTWAAIESLKKLKDKFGLDVPFDESMKNAILSTLMDGELNHKIAAASLITAFEDKDIIEASLKILGDNQEIDENIRQRFFENPKFLYPRITEYLTQNPDNLKGIIELVMEIVQNDGGESFYELSEFDRRQFSNVLTENLEYPDEEVRRAVIELLFFADMEVAMMFLDTMIEDDDVWNKLRVLEIIETLDDPRVKDAASRLTNDPDEMVSERANQILANFNTTE